MKLRNYNKITHWTIIPMTKELEDRFETRDKSYPLINVVKSFKFLDDARKYVEERQYLWGTASKIVGRTKDYRKNIRTTCYYRYYPNWSTMAMEWIKYPDSIRLVRWSKKYDKMTKGDRIHEINLNKRCEIGSNLDNRFTWDFSVSPNVKKPAKRTQSFKEIEAIYHKIIATFEPQNYDLFKIEYIVDEDNVEYFNSSVSNWNEIPFEEKLDEWIGNIHYWSDRYNDCRLYTMIKQFDLLKKEYYGNKKA